MMKRHELTKSQAQLLAEIEVRKQSAAKEWNVAIMLVGLDPAKVVGGELISDPHLLVEDN
jgi:hypothetical protein